MRRRIFALALLPIAAGLAAGSAAADSATATFYKQTCGICHGENGEGIPQLGPALKGNQFVTTAEMKEIVDTITKGRQGDQKRHKDLASPMPAHSISGKKLQELLDYLRNDLQK